MVDLKLTNAYSPMLFSLDGYQVVVMPMMTNEANQQAKKDKEAKTAEPVPTEQAEAEEKEVKPAEVKAEKPKKAKRSREKEPVTA
jgi:DNA polymerase-3 subunit beta